MLLLILKCRSCIEFQSIVGNPQVIH